jgi:hypothetical protein
MEKQKRTLQIWWPVYAEVLVMIGLLVLTHYVAPSPSWRTFLDIGLLVIGPGLMMMWLESHPAPLLDQPPTEAESSIVKLSPSEVISPTSSPVQYEFYVGSDSPIIYGGPGHSRSNGYHHPVNSIFFSPEKAAESFSNS